ncbi:hypothetical protein HPP92_012868 [Vanilla planifolia]|uniref:Uncharacterized protein n=1 Tax=Vanilla planifolia TaxID=51239 RepID=A0A835UW85_VANPL|nr:hypothetical protein HPP92_012868 [Vanilla planifolia]
MSHYNYRPNIKYIELFREAKLRECEVLPSSKGSKGIDGIIPTRFDFKDFNKKPSGNSSSSLQPILYVAFKQFFE